MARAAADPQRDLLQAYDVLFGPRSSDGARVIADIVLFVQSEKGDPAVRAGRADVLAHILRAVHRLREIPREIPVSSEEE